MTILSTASSSRTPLYLDSDGSLNRKSENTYSVATCAMAIVTPSISSGPKKEIAVSNLTHRTVDSTVIAGEQQISRVPGRVHYDYYNSQLILSFDGFKLITQHQAYNTEDVLCICCCPPTPRFFFFTPYFSSGKPTLFKGGLEYMEQINFQSGIISTIICF